MVVADRYTGVFYGAGWQLHLSHSRLPVNVASASCKHRVHKDWLQGVQQMVDLHTRSLEAIFCKMNCIYNFWAVLGEWLEVHNFADH